MILHLGHRERRWVSERKSLKYGHQNSTTFSCWTATDQSRARARAKWIALRPASPSCAWAGRTRRATGRGRRRRAGLVVLQAVLQVCAHSFEKRRGGGGQWPRQFSISFLCDFSLSLMLQKTCHRANLLIISLHLHSLFPIMLRLAFSLTGFYWILASASDMCLSYFFLDFLSLFFLHVWFNY